MQGGCVGLDHLERQDVRKRIQSIQLPRATMLKTGPLFLTSGVVKFGLLTQGQLRVNGKAALEDRSCSDWRNASSWTGMRHSTQTRQARDYQ